MYNLIIIILGLFIRISSIFNSKAKRWIDGRKKGFTISHNDENRIWVHCASLGEYEQSFPIIKRIKEEYPSYKILLSFFSPSGYDNYKYAPEIDYICYLPLDTKKNARKFVQNMNPKLAIFVKYEFWYNYIDTLYENNIPIFFICCNFRENQYFFKPYGKIFLKHFEKITHFFVQNEKSKELFQNKNINKVTVCGDTRFDRVISISKISYKDKIIEHFIDSEKNVLVAGSTWAKDNLMIKSSLEYLQEFKIIIAPHEINQKNLSQLKSLFPNCLLYSQTNTNEVLSCNVLIIDKIGILSKIYRYAKIAYIGGGFGRGIHNTLEAAVYNIPVIFGPNYFKFTEAIEMIDNKIAFSFSSKQELKAIFEYLSEEGNILYVNQACKKFFSKNVGSSDVIINTINEFH